MFGSSLLPEGSSLIYGMLFVFVCVKWCPTHIVLFFFDRLQWKKLVTNTVKPEYVPLFRKLQGFLDAFFILSKQTLGLV
jgi:hypothetical protein